MSAQSTGYRLQRIGNRFIKKLENPKTYNLQPTTSKQGFTLIELMVTIAIIAILSSVGIVVYSSAQKSGRVSKRAQDLRAMASALELYKSATGGYPVVGAFGCVGTAIAALAPTYMPVIPADPLDSGDASGANCYQYKGTTNEYKLRTRSTIASSGEMSSTNFKTQPNLIDPMSDGAGDCTVTTSGSSQAGWAVYSTSGIDPATNACGY